MRCRVSGLSVRIRRAEREVLPLRPMSSAIFGASVWSTAGCRIEAQLEWGHTGGIRVTAAVSWGAVTDAGTIGPGPHETD